MNHFFRSFVLIVSLFLMIQPSGRSQTAIERLKSEYPAVMEQYGKRLEAQKADYVIAIDVSGTMMKHKDLVLPALSSFIDALPDGDYLSIIKFGTKAQECGLSGKVDKGSRENFKNTLLKVYERDDAFFFSTDVYAASEAVLAQLSRPGSNDLKYVFMFTDFLDESGHKDADWQSLGSRVNAMSKDNTIRAFAMQLPGENSGRDVNKVRMVFPNLQTINVDNSASLNEWFEGQKADIIKTRLKDLIRGDFDKWYSEKNIKTSLAIGLDHKLRLKYEVDGNVVPAFVNGLFISSCELIAQSNNIEKVEFATDSVYKGRSISSVIGALKFFNKSPIQSNTKVTMSVTYRPMFTMAEKEGDPSFANEIRNLEIENDLMRTEELTAEKGFVFGWNIWLFSICCGLLAAWLFLFIMNTLRIHRLGYLNLLIRDDKGNTQVHNLPNKRIVTIGADKCDISVPAIASSLVLKGLSGSPLSLIKRRVVAECKCGTTSTDYISIGGKSKKSNKFHRLKLQQSASISSIGVLNFSVAERNANRGHLKSIIACVLFIVVTLAVLAVSLFI